MNKYFLHINEPCSQDWETMTPTEQGRFCNNCQKTVFDFTNATDTEIVKHIEKMKGNMFCGQFEEGQLNRWMEKSNLETSNPSLYRYLLGFIMLVGGQNVVAQEVGVRQEHKTEIKSDKTKTVNNVLQNCEDSTMNGLKVDAGIKNFRLRGGVTSLSSSHQPLYVVDGIVIDSLKLKELEVNKVKDINVLQSAQAMAVFGPNGANGAIIITTKAFAKKPTKQKPKK